ncbi:MAG: 3-methylitaconate isomerase, partial [Desulfobacterales bacterium]|nr:3-methylitaconate isomerase [Desulfobacterales bacterium]
MKMLRCVIIRGGTSRGVYFHENELPPDRHLRDKIILDVFGSPDVREIDGLGGADILTSKVCIIGPSMREDADVDYTFGQVIIDKPIVDYSINCGNLSSGVGPFAIDEGLVKPVEPITTVRIYNTNTKKILVAGVPVRGGKAVVEGDYRIDGVPGTGAKIALDFAATAGTIKGTLLPTGKVREVLSIDEIGEIPVSIVDAANPTVFAFAEDVGIEGTERFQDLLSNREIWRKVEAIRGAAA